MNGSPPAITDLDTAASDDHADDVARVLRSRLGRIAGERARAALDAYRRQSFEAFYVEAGISLELAMKAKLAGISPYLLAPDSKGWFKHGHQLARGVTTAKGLRSASAEESLQRLMEIEPSVMSVIASQIGDTIMRRDQSVHLGVFVEPTGDELLSHAAAFVEAVNGLLVQNPTAFWGDLASLAAELVAAEKNGVRIRVAQKFATAHELLASLTDEQRELLSSSGEPYIEFRKDETPELVLVTCPVCSYEGIGNGEIDDRGEPVWDHREPDPVGWSYDFRTVLTSFECRVCQLDLSGPAEIRAAGLPEDVDNDHVDPSWFYESDWDTH